MTSNLYRLTWRRQLSFFIIFLFGIVLITFWSWTFFGINRRASLESFSKVDYTEKREGLLKKLISQANRVLQYQHNQQNVIAQKKIRTLGTTPPQAFDLVPRLKKAPKVVGASFLFEEERLKILENQQRMRNIGIEDTNNIFNNMDYDRMPSSSERQLQYERDLQRMGVPVIAGLGPEDDHVPPQERLVHLDLKGAPPKLSYLKQLLPIFKSLGATGLLIEYEDMFPYSGPLNCLAAMNAYSIHELKDFLQAASLHGLSIVPLIQTFGHMEFVLKSKDFAHLREIPESPQSICPSKKETQPLIEEMLTQVIELHLRSLVANTSVGHADVNDKGTALVGSPQDFTHIHIGCDEVYRMGSCEECRQRSKHEIFLTHVIMISNFIRSKWPDLKVIIWDDMLRDMTLSEMQHMQVGRFVEPMIWVYGMDVYQYIPPHLWDIYSKVFPTAWAASAFKGAFGESLLIPPLQRHLENNMRWLAVLAKESERFSKGLKGLALTGWQRYDHFAALCELLPTAMPSLITSLTTVSKGYFNTEPKENNILHVLECAFYPDSRHSGRPWIELHPNLHHCQLFLSCNYPGSEMYKYSVNLFEKLAEAQNYLMQVEDKSAWMSSYNVRHNFSSPLRVHDLTANTPIIINDLTLLSKDAHSLMQNIYDEHTIAEFIEQNIYPIIVRLRQQLTNGNELLQRSFWPQRPLPYVRELIDLNLISNEKESSTGSLKT